MQQNIGVGGGRGGYGLRGRGRGGNRNSYRSDGGGGFQNNVPLGNNTSFQGQQNQMPGAVSGGFQPLGGGGGPKQVKIAQHVQFNRALLLNTSSFPAEKGAGPLTSCSVQCIPGVTPKVRVFSGDDRGNVRQFIWADSGSWIQERIATHNNCSITSLLAFSEAWLFVGLSFQNPQGQKLGGVKAYNLVDNRDFEFVAHMNSVTCLCIGGEYLITGGGDGHVKAWRFNETAWNLVGDYGGDAGAHINSEVVAATSKIPGSLITCSSTGELKVWSLGTGECVMAKQAHTGPVGGVDVLVAGDKFFIVTCGSMDHTVRLWSAPTLDPLHEITVAPQIPGRPPNVMTALKIVSIRDQQHLFVGFWNGSVQVYNMKSPTHFDRLGVVDGHERKAKIVAFDTLALQSGLMFSVVTDKGVVNWFSLN